MTSISEGLFLLHLASDITLPEGGSISVERSDSSISATFPVGTVMGWEHGEARVFVVPIPRAAYDAGPMFGDDSPPEWADYRAFAIGEREISITASAVTEGELQATLQVDAATINTSSGGYGDSGTGGPTATPATVSASASGGISHTSADVSISVHITGTMGGVTLTEPLTVRIYDVRTSLRGRPESLTPNVIKDPSFEEGSNLLPVGQRSSAFARTGTHSWQLTPANAGAIAWVHPRELHQDRRVYGEVWVRPPVGWTGGTVDFGLSFYSSQTGGTTHSTAWFATLTPAELPSDYQPGQWVKVSGSITPPATYGGRYARARVSISAPTATGTEGFHFDDFYMKYLESSVDVQRSGAAEISVSTSERAGLVAELRTRSRSKIPLEIARPDRNIRGGDRVELAAWAASSEEMSWRWKVVGRSDIDIRIEGSTCSFIAPDAEGPETVRVAVMAADVSGFNRSDWSLIDLEILPAMARYAPDESGFDPVAPQLIGYNRGKREIWNDVLDPVGMDPASRYEPEIVDLGIPVEDVALTDGDPPPSAVEGGIYIDINTGIVYRNFGAGYNESEDTVGSPRARAYKIDPSTGVVYEWIEET